MATKTHDPEAFASEIDAIESALDMVETRVSELRSKAAELDKAERAQLIRELDDILAELTCLNPRLDALKERS